MTPEDITAVLRSTLRHLQDHFERELIPDNEYVPLIRVIISSGVSLLTGQGAKQELIQRFEKELYTEAKAAWVKSCAGAFDSEAEYQQQIPILRKDFERMYRKKSKK